MKTYNPVVPVAFAFVLFLGGVAGCADDLRARADQGDAEAQFALGAVYATGRGVPQDAREAVRWFRLAAEQGHAAAQASLELLEEAR